jgi:hypothetical protein
LPPSSGAIDSPRPSAVFVDIMMFYTIALIAAKMLYQLPIFCGTPPYTLRTTRPDESFTETPVPPSTLAYCPIEEQGPSAQGREAFLVALPSRVDYKLGVYKFGQFSPLQTDTPLAILGPDLLVLVLLVLERITTRARGEGQLPRELPRGCLKSCGDARMLLRLVMQPVLSAFWSVRGFYRRLLPPLTEAKRGEDLHVSSFLVLLFMLLFNLFFFASMTPSTSGTSCSTGASPINLNQFEQNQLDLSTVIAMIITIAIMLLDRVIYRRWEPPVIRSRSSSQMPATAPFTPVGDGASSSNVTPSAKPEPAQLLAPAEGGAGGWCESLPPAAPLFKLILHVTLTLAVHYIVFLDHLPAWNCPSIDCATSDQYETGGCKRNSAVTFFYLLCCWYLWLSAKQIKEGFPLIVLEHPLTDSSSLLALYVNAIFINFPFLWEFRIIVDWTFTPNTALDLFMWLKLEDIYQGLCLTRMIMKGRLQMPRATRQPTYYKILLGGSLLIVMLLVTVGPLILFSPASPIQSGNDLTSARVRLFTNIGTDDTPDTTVASQAVIDGGLIELGVISRYRLTRQAQLEPRQLAALRTLYGEWATSWWVVQLASATEDQWLVNEETMDALSVALQSASNKTSSTHGVTIGITLTLSRYAGRDIDIKLLDDHVLSSVELQQMLRVTTWNLNNDTRVEIDRQSIPQIVRLPTIGATGAGAQTTVNPVILDSQIRNVTFIKKSAKPVAGAFQQFWSLDITNSTSAIMSGLEHGFSGPITLIVASDALAGDVLTNALGVGGIVAFYSIIFLSVFRIVRGFTAESRHRIHIDELPDARDLVDLCDGVYIARRYSDLERETSLFETILRLYRSPEAMLSVTGSFLKYD